MDVFVTVSVGNARATPSLHSTVERPLSSRNTRHSGSRNGARSRKRLIASISKSILLQLSGEFLDGIITSLHLATAIPIFIVGSSQAQVRLQTYLLMMRLGQASLGLRFCCRPIAQMSRQVAKLVKFIYELYSVTLQCDSIRRLRDPSPYY